MYIFYSFCLVLLHELLARGYAEEDGTLSGACGAKLEVCRRCGRHLTISAI